MRPGIDHVVPILSFWGVLVYPELNCNGNGNLMVRVKYCIFDQIILLPKGLLVHVLSFVHIHAQSIFTISDVHGELCFCGWKCEF